MVGMGMTASASAAGHQYGFGSLGITFDFGDSIPVRIIMALILLYCPVHVHQYCWLLYCQV